MASVTKVDPVTFEIIRHKLYSVMDEAIIALENVSGSPITNEGHDLMASLYKADGGLMVGGVGFLHHLTSAAQAVNTSSRPTPTTRASTRTTSTSSTTRTRPRSIRPTST